MINWYGIALATSYHLIMASHEFCMRGRITKPDFEVGNSTEVIFVFVFYLIFIGNII